MERPGAMNAVRASLGLLVAGPLLAVLAVSRALPPADLAGAGVVWVPVSLAVTLVVIGALAAVAWLVIGLRDGRVDTILVASASGAVAGGAVAWLSGAPFLLPLVLSAAAVLAAAIVGRRPIELGRLAHRATAAGALLAVVEVGVLVELLPGTRALVDPIRDPLAIVGAGCAVVASLLAVGRGVGAIATAAVVGLAAMAVARGTGIETVIGLGALIGSQIIALMVTTAPRAPSVGAADERLPDLAAQVADAVLRFDGRLRLRDWNPTATNLLGLDADSAGTHLEDLLAVALSDLPLPGGPATTVAGVGGLRIGLQRAGDGLTAVISDPGGSPQADRLGRELRGTIEELLQARRTIDLQRQELERASAIDPLTGVASRAAILERLHVEVAQARRYQHPVAVVLLDLDDFAAVNRSHGTTGGDIVLREVALRLRLRVREADELARFGSDAFLAVLPHTEEAGAATFADALQHRLGLRPITVNGTQLTPTASIGVAIMRPGEDLDVDGLLARADEALASAKRAGGNRISLDRLHGLARLEEREASGPESGSTDTDAV